MYEAKFLEVPLDIFKYGPVKGSTVFNVMRGLGGLYLLAAQVECYEYYECIHSIAVYSKLHILYKHNLCAYSMIIVNACRDQICSVQRSIHFPSVGGKTPSVIILSVSKLICWLSSSQQLSPCPACIDLHCRWL